MARILDRMTILHYNYLTEQTPDMSCLISFYLLNLLDWLSEVVFLRLLESLVVSQLQILSLVSLSNYRLGENFTSLLKSAKFFFLADQSKASFLSCLIKALNFHLQCHYQFIVFLPLISKKAVKQYVGILKRMF